MRIKAFPFQRHETGILALLRVGNDRIEREIRPGGVRRHDIGNFAERYANHAITPANARCGQRSE